MNEWIAIKDRIPTLEECQKNYGWFLVFRRKDLRADTSRYDGHNEEYSYDHGWKYSWDHDIIFWMPLPEIPDVG